MTSHVAKIMILVAALVTTTAIAASSALAVGPQTHSAETITPTPKMTHQLNLPVHPLRIGDHDLSSALLPLAMCHQYCDIADPQLAANDHRLGDTSRYTIQTQTPPSASNLHPRRSPRRSAAAAA
jgi:hypothetical protein